MYQRRVTYVPVFMEIALCLNFFLCVCVPTDRFVDLLNWLWGKIRSGNQYQYKFQSLFGLMKLSITTRFYLENMLSQDSPYYSKNRKRVWLHSWWLYGHCPEISKLNSDSSAASVPILLTAEFLNQCSECLFKDWPLSIQTLKVLNTSFSSETWT